MLDGDVTRLHQGTAEVRANTVKGVMRMLRGEGQSQEWQQGEVTHLHQVTGVRGNTVQEGPVGAGV